MAETFREGVAELEQGASGSGHPAPRSTQQDALGPCSTSRALKGNTKGTVALPWPPAPAVRPGSAWELGAAAGSRSVTEHGSGGTVMAAGSSTDAGLRWVGKRAPKDSVNSAALGAQAPRLSYPISVQLPPQRPPRRCSCYDGVNGAPSCSCKLPYTRPCSS